MSSRMTENWVKVWDPLVRYGHWVLAAAFFIAWFSGDDDGYVPDVVHVWAGYTVGIIVAIRLAWGLIGTRHARFIDFLYGPMAVRQYMIDLIHSRARRYLGHSPAGAAMVFALLLSLSGTVATGLVAYGYSGMGPLAGAPAVTSARADDSKRRPEHASAPSGKREDTLVGDLHGLLGNVTLGLVILHILGVGLASFVHRENLVLSMLTGRKRPDSQTRV